MTDIDPELRRLADAIEQSHESWLLLGRAGTGKTTLLRLLRKHSRKSIAFLAPTGVAALNIGGETLHSFFRFKPPFEYLQPRKLWGNALRELECVVIDEISMVSPQLLDAVDQSLRLNGPRRDRPFGGVQMILVGDLYQLPPVENKPPAEPGPELVEYDSPYFFSAKVLERWTPRLHELQRIYRQTNIEFLDLLQAVREGQLSDRHWNLLNSRVEPDAIDPESDEYLVLTTTNWRVQQLNDRYLQALPGELQTYAAYRDGDFPVQHVNVESELRLKEGAQIMFVRNKTGSWQNGTLGRVVGLEAEKITVEVPGTDKPDYLEVPYEKWEAYRMDFDAEEGRWKPKVRGSLWQLPVRLARAITIHKSQGKTYDKAAIDLGSGAFAHGQLYVALSRCRTLENVVLTRPVRETDLIVDPRVREWMQQVGVD